MVKVFLNQIQSAAGLTLFTTNSSGDPQYFAANTASRVVAVNSAGTAFELKDYSNWDTAFSWGNHASAGYLTTAVAATTYVPYTGASANVNLGEYGIAGGFFSFDTTPTTYSAAVGRLGWNDTNGTLEMLLKGGNVLHTVGETTFARVYNNTGSSISRGQVVYISGSSGTRLTVDLADADTEATSKNTLGFAAETIGINSEGFVMISGLISNINTSGYADGATIYLSSTAGGYTNTAPTHPAHTVILGFVVKGGSTGGGSIFVKVNNGYEIDELHNVLISSVQPNDVLYYDNATQLWKNASIVSKIAANTLSLSQLPQIATSSFLGRVTAGTGNVEVLTGTQATSLLDLFSTTTTTKGLVPGSNGVGTTYFLRADGTWAVPAGGGGGSGTVTSVDLSMPTGFTVSNNPVTTSGTLTVAFASGYSLPTNTSQTNWNTAYGWGDHATQGYLTGIATNSITDSMLRQSAALSVIGRATNTSGNVADIVAGNDYEIFRRSGSSIGFGSIDLSQAQAVGTSRLQYSNLAQGAALSVLGVAGNLANDVASINAASDFHVLRRSGTSLGFGTLNAAAMNSTYTSGQYLTTDALGNLSWATISGGGGGIGGSTGSVDNAMLRADGTGGATLQSSDIGINDATTSTQTNVTISNLHSGQTNSSLVLAPKGTGALILGPKPDGGTTGGNARGTYAVDLQIVRSANTQVASGSYSITAGQNNTVSAPHSAAFGISNTISGTGFSFAAGHSNTVNAQRAAAIGTGNIASKRGAIALGENNTSNGDAALAVGLASNAQGNYSFAGGWQAGTTIHGQDSFSSGQFSAVGDNIRFTLSAWRSFTGTTATDLTVNNGTLSATSALVLPATNSVWAFRVQLIGVCTATGGSINLNDSFMGVYEGTIKRVNTTMSISSIDTVTTKADGGFSANTPTISITADSTNRALSITWTTVGGNASTAMRVSATVYVTAITW